MCGGCATSSGRPAITSKQFEGSVIGSAKSDAHEMGLFRCGDRASRRCIVHGGSGFGHGERLHVIPKNISGGQRPSTFLVSGAEGPHRVGIALEAIYQQQRELERRIADRASGANAVFESFSDGLLIVNERHEIRFVNQTFRNLFPADEGEFRGPMMQVIRDPVVDRLIDAALKSGEPERGELAISAPER